MHQVCFQLRIPRSWPQSWIILANFTRAWDWPPRQEPELHTALAFRIGHALVAQSLFASYRTCSIAVAVAIAAPTSLGAAARSKLMEICIYRKKQIGVLATNRRECPNVDCHIRREWQRCLLVERDGTLPALDVNRCTRRTSQRTGHGDPDGVWATGAACS